MTSPNYVDMDSTTNALNWFEIPATDLERAQKFYETIFDITMEGMQMEDGGLKMAMFPFEDGNGKASGGVAQSDFHTPSEHGAIIYLNGNPDLADALGRVEAAGGKITMPKTQISPEIGHMAYFIDTEGNKVALHSQN